MKITKTKSRLFKEYFYIGKTINKWYCENFRYDDTGNNMTDKINKRMGG